MGSTSAKLCRSGFGLSIGGFRRRGVTFGRIAFFKDKTDQDASLAVPHRDEGSIEKCPTALIPHGLLPKKARSVFRMY